MKAAIRHFDPARTFYTDEKCYINELSNLADEDDLSIALASVKPGITTRWHRLSAITERYVILEGQGLVEVGDEPAKEVKYGDVVIIPSGCRQRITNIGAEDLVFLAICTPRFQQSGYQDCDDPT